jgi:hypothetical protein
MESERKTLEKLSAVSDVKMSSHKQQEIWDTIEREIDQMEPVRAKRRSNLWGTGAAAVAAVAIVAGGFYAFSHHGLMQSNKPGVTTASHDTTPNPAVKFPTASSIQSISIFAGSTMNSSTTQDPKSVSTQVINWLNNSTLYTGSIPKSTNSIVPKSYTGPAQLKMKTANGDVTVYPVYYLVQINNNGVETRYLQDVVEYQMGNQTVYLKSPQLFNWLKNSQWKSEFTASLNSTMNSQPSKAALAKMTPKELANYAQSHGGPLPSAGTNVQRVDPSKSQVFFGAPSVSTVNNKTVQATDFKVVDFWSGTIQGNAFQLQVSKATNGKTFVVDVWSGSKGTAIELSKQPWITNFTGSYVIFASPNPAQGMMYAIDLANATIVPNSTLNSEYIRLMSGIGMGGYPGQIEGLPNTYDIFPNGQQGY